MTMGNSWSYVPNDVYKPASELVKKLVDIVSKDGNYLLNIGPNPDGEFDDTAYTRLKQIGDWMKINSSAIYNTRMFTVFGEGGNIRFTQSKDGKTKYIFLFNYPSGKIIITKMPFAKNAVVQMLGSSARLKWKDTDNGIELTVPDSLKKVNEYVWVLKVKE